MNEAQLAHGAALLEQWALKNRQHMLEVYAQHGGVVPYMRSFADEIFELDEHECWVIKSPAWEELDRVAEVMPDMAQALQVGYCGYAVFKPRPVVEPGMKGIITYVPVHGGITFMVEDQSGAVYGFDTCHYNSSNFPNRDKNWIKWQIQVMIEGIKLAAQLEPEYLAADLDNSRKAEIIDRLRALVPEEELNFMTILNALSSEL